MAMYKIKAKDCLSNRGFHRCGGFRSGAAFWWLRGDDGFVDIKRSRGDVCFTDTVDLSPGKYVLGVGRGRDAIRLRFVVKEDGSVMCLDRDIEVEKDGQEQENVA